MFYDCMSDEAERRFDWLTDRRRTPIHTEKWLKKAFFQCNKYIKNILVPEWDDGLSCQLAIYEYNSACWPNIKGMLSLTNWSNYVQQPLAH